jgi:hypothetical protein
MGYRVSFDYRLTRRIDWATDPVAFHSHINDVCIDIQGYPQVHDVRAISDIVRSCLTLEFTVEASDERVAAMCAVEILRTAIGNTGARRIEGQTESEEAPLPAGVPTLHTPVWKQRRLLVAAAA